jgi:hypothetical protein
MGSPDQGDGLGVDGWRTLEKLGGGVVGIGVCRLVGESNC